MKCLKWLWSPVDCTRRVGRFSVVSSLSAALLLVMGGAVSAGPSSNPDGGPASATIGEAQFLTDCRADVQHRIITEDVASDTNNSAFATFVGLSVFVPANTTRCILVEFNAETACRNDAGTGDDYCYLRALANGLEMLPISGSLTVFQSEDPTAEGNSARWVRRVSGASTGVNFNVGLQRRVDGGTTGFYLDDWMFSVSVLQ